MTLFVFSVIVTLLCWGDYVKNGRRLSPFTVFAVPYLAIILINNLFAVKFGFYSISDNTIFMLLITIILFFAGSLFAYCVGETQGVKLQNSCTVDKFQYYDMRKMLKYATFVEIVGLIRLFLLIVRHGFAYLTEKEGIFLTTPVAHLLLTLYVLIPIIFYYWLKNKSERQYLLVVIVALALFSMSFVKYHVLSLIILMFLFVSFEDRKYIKSGMIFMCIIVFSFFAINYIIDFFLKGVLDSDINRFVIVHFWKYVAGGTINTNILFTNDAPEYVDGIYKIMHLIFTLPNMFISKILGTKLFMNISDIGFHPVSDIGETSNVICFTSYIFPTYAKLLDLIVFGCTLVGVSWFMTALYIVAKKRRTSFLVCCFVPMLFFCFLAFFGNYGGLSMPWELIVWAAIIPGLFKIKDKKVK